MSAAEGASAASGEASFASGVAFGTPGDLGIASVSVAVSSARDGDGDNDGDGDGDGSASCTGRTSASSGSASQAGTSTSGSVALAVDACDAIGWDGSSRRAGPGLGDSSGLPLGGGSGGSRPSGVSDNSRRQAITKPAYSSGARESSFRL